MILDITGFARKLEEGHSELTMRLDRIIELLEALALQGDGPTSLHPVETHTRAV